MRKWLLVPVYAAVGLNICILSSKPVPCYSFQSIGSGGYSLMFNVDQNRPMLTTSLRSPLHKGSYSSPIIAKSRMITSLSETGDSMPTWSELSQQKSEALRSLSSYHDGEWICEDGALSFSITSDVTGGITRKKRSVPYYTSVSTRLGLSGGGSTKGLKIAETFSWDKDSAGTVGINTNSDGKDDTLAGNTVFVRACSLGSTIDIDSVDASFSLDGFCSSLENENTEASASCGLPMSISGVDSQKVSFVIEKVLVLGETERARCFFLYGEQENNVAMEATLLRVVISYERKVNTPVNTQDETIIPTKYSQLDQLTDVIGNLDNNGNNCDDRILSPMSLMKLSLGPWLGDIIIRDKSFNDALPKSASVKKERSSKKGFGRTPPEKSPTSPEKNDPNEGFAEWILGVQKAAITFKWDVGQNILQGMSFGKCLGCGTSSEWPMSSRGMIYDDDGMSRRFEPEERMVYIDYDTGIYGGFIIGSAYLKAPRFFKFNNSPRSNGLGFPMLTEFAVFQKNREDEESNPAMVTEENMDDENKGQDVCCRITRLYGRDCKFKQGCTSFFTLKPVVEDFGL